MSDTEDNKRIYDKDSTECEDTRVLKTNKRQLKLQNDKVPIKARFLNFL